MRVKRHLWVVVLVAMGCGDRNMGMLITVENTRSQVVLLSGNEAPVNVFGKTAGEEHRWFLSPGAGGILCSQCEAACASTDLPPPMFPVYIEVPAGERYDLHWDGTVYRWQEKGCACGKDCYEPVPLDHGEFHVTVKYRGHLPSHDGNVYTRKTGSDGFNQLVGNKEGAADTQSAHSKTVDYNGQAQIDLDFWEDCRSDDEIHPAPNQDAACKGITGCLSLIPYELGCHCSFCQHERCVQVTCVD